MPGGLSRARSGGRDEDDGEATLTVQVHEARKLKPGLDGTSNAYATVKVIESGCSRKTNVVPDAANPKWDDDSFEFRVPAPPAPRRGSADWSQVEGEVLVEVWSQEDDRMGDPTDRLIGDRRYALSRFVDAGSAFERQWCALAGHGGQLRLSVRLELPGGGGGGDSDGGGGGGGGGENAALRRAFDAERKGVTTRNAPTLIRKISKKPMLSSMHRKIAAFAKDENLASNDPIDFATFQRLFEALFPPSSSSGRGSSASDASRSRAAEGLARGDKCEARYGGKSKWYGGKVAKCNANGTFDITYDDGDSERGVRAALVRAVGGAARASGGRGRADATDDSAAEGFSRGDKVEARFGGKSAW